MQDHSLNLNPRLLAAWESTMLAFCRLPPGTSRQPSQRSRVIKRLVEQEAPGVRDLWETFTTNRGDIPRYLMNPARQTAAYLAGFHLANAARITSAFTRARTWAPDALQTDPGQPGRIRIFDPGCGTAAMSQALLHMPWLVPADRPVSLWLTDLRSRFLQAAEHGLRAEQGERQLIIHTSAKGIGEATVRHLQQTGDETALDLICCGYLWNELKPNRAARGRLLRLLEAGARAPHRTLVALAEPANQYLAREAMELRDRLVQMGYRIIYPCPGSAPCPMLRRSRDWCYSEFLWNRPPAMERLDRLVRRNRARLHSAVWILTNDQQTPLPTVSDKGPVLVGRPLKKGSARAEWLLCEDRELKRINGPARGQSEPLRGTRQQGRIRPAKAPQR